MVYKFTCAAGAILVLLSSAVSAQTVQFGNDSSKYSNDNECDDRRFIGTSMARDLDSDDNYRDASDCQRLYSAGMIKLVDVDGGQAATQCNAIDFGDDTSDWANDDECDDPRFDGPGSAQTIAAKDLLKDATDCKATCEAGTVWLRISR